MSKRIAIIGGGYLGAELANSLDEVADITLIEPRSHFVHAPAMIRAVVDPSLLDRALIPYDRLLNNGRILRARATGIDANGVTLDNCQRVEVDYIVVATGSSNAMPFKPVGDDIKGLRRANQRVHDQLKAARTIGIVGAGAVGTELAGEIAHAFPNKTVHLVSSEATLFPNHPPKLGRELTAKLKASGVSLNFGARAENLESLSVPYAGTLSLSNGAQIEADLIFPVIGSKAISTLLQTLPGAQFGRADRVKTDAWLRPSQFGNVFAAGDAAETGDVMTVVGASRQVAWLTKALTAVLEGREVEDLKSYAPWGPKAPFLVPLGPKLGNSFLGFFTAGSVITRKLKGEDLFLSKYNKLMGRTG
jgi:apoptosis-inducing factor 2